MSIAEIIYAHSRRLPEQAAREALRYIEELERRYDVRPADNAGPDTTEAFIAAICGGLSDDFPDAITDADLRAVGRVRDSVTRQSTG